MSKLKYKYIAIDFDGTIVRNDYPKIGMLMPDAVRVIRKIKEHGGKIAIWTCRTGLHQKLVKKFLDHVGIPYDVINENFPERIMQYGNDSRKISADVYIDDLCIFCKKIDWREIEKLLFVEEDTDEQSS